jgi:large subunit ribosomal protein L22
MQVSAHLREVRISPQKVRLVADMVRNKSAEQALNILRYLPQKASYFVAKCLNSAIANAENNLGADVDDLKISEIYVNQGLKLKRIRARAKGRANRILKPYSAITITVSDE